MCCRVNTFDNKVNVGKDENGDIIYHMPHEYTDLLENIYKKHFLTSMEYKKFCAEQGRERKIGYTKFLEGVRSCPCIREPKMRSCVDEVETEMAESIYSLRCIQRLHLDCTCSFCVNCVEMKKRGTSYFEKYVDFPCFMFIFSLCNNI